MSVPPSLSPKARKKKKKKKKKKKEKEKEILCVRAPFALHQQLEKKKEKKT